SALCLRAAVSKPVREMSCKICEKILHTLFKAESSSDSLLFANSTYQRLSAFFFPAALSTAELIWTKMIPTAIGTAANKYHATGKRRKLQPPNQMWDSRIEIAPLFQLTLGIAISFCASAILCRAASLAS